MTIHSHAVMRAACAVLLVLMAAACGRRNTTPQPVATTFRQLTVEARLFSDDEDVGIRDSTAVVLRTRAELEQAWRRIAEPRTTRTALSDWPGLDTVDFQRNMLLLVAAGRMRRGDAVRVDSIGLRREPDDTGRMRELLVVEYTITEACRGYPDASHPLVIVRVARSEEPLRFNARRERAASCR